MSLNSTNAREVISKLKNFNFPILRGVIQPFEIELMEKEVEEIEESIVYFKDYLNQIKNQIKTNN